jgi:DNA-binding transcriptional ArsR family regulator
MARPLASDGVFRAIADPSRRRMLQLLAQEDRTVSDLAQGCALTMPLASSHLRILREAGLVTTRREGRQRRSSIRVDPLREVAAWMVHFDAFWTDRLQALGESLRRREGGAG